MNFISGWGLLARSMFGHPTGLPPRIIPDGNSIEVKSGLRRWRIRRELEQGFREKPSRPDDLGR